MFLNLKHKGVLNHWSHKKAPRGFHNDTVTMTRSCNNPITDVIVSGKIKGLKFFSKAKKPSEQGT